MTKTKPKLTSKQLISKLKQEKGILFNITSETDAETYLRIDFSIEMIYNI